MGNSRLFQSTAGKFQRGTDSTECRNLVPTHPHDVSALFLTSALNGRCQDLRLRLPKEEAIVSRRRLQPRFVLGVFLAALSDTVVDEIAPI